LGIATSLDCQSGVPQARENCSLTPRICVPQPQYQRGVGSGRASRLCASWPPYLVRSAHGRFMEQR
jgi:hypothetical protein